MLSRRLFPIAGAAMMGSMTYMFYPPRVKADVKRYSLDEKRMKELNERDHKQMIDGYLKGLTVWKPTSMYGKTLETMDASTLFNLSYMSTMYQPPLKDYQRIKIREDIVNYYKNAKSEEEKAIFINILTYYNLME